MRLLRMSGALPLLLASVALAQDNNDVDVYLDYPAGVWRDQSNARLVPQSTVHVHSHQFAMQVTMDPYTYVRFRHTWGGLTTTGFSHLEFWIHGGTTGSQRISVQTVVQNVRGPALSIRTYATILPNEWTRVRIPLTDLGCANVAGMADIYIIETKGYPVPEFWIDDIRVLKAPSSQEPAIHIDTNNTLAVVNSRMFGAATFTWDGRLNAQSTLDRIAESGITLLTFPGGTSANAYDWFNNRARNTGFVGEINTQAFLQVANAVGAEKVIAVNYGSGTPEEARDWVQYTNITLGGDVLYWIIGNECYGWWEYDQHQYQFDALTYADFVRDCYRLMKAVDPRIKIGVSGTVGEDDFAQRVSVVNPRTGISHSGWGPVLLNKLRKYNIVPDFWDYHFYPVLPFRENDSYLLQSPKAMGVLNTITRRMVRDYLGEVGDSVPFYITESNSTVGFVGKQSTSIVNALYLVKSWYQAAVLNMGCFIWWNLHNSAEVYANNSITLHGWRMYGDYGMLASGFPVGRSEPLNTPYPTFYAYKLLKAFIRPGDRLVAATSTSDFLFVMASVSATTGRLNLFVINDSKYRTLRAPIFVSGYTLPFNARYYQYGIAEDEGMQDITAGTVSMIRMKSDQPLEYPPYSMTVVEF